MTAKTLVLVLMLAVVVLGAGAVDAITVYPIDRAQILAGSRFDFKVEFDGIVASADTKVTINGRRSSRPRSAGPPTFVEAARPASAPRRSSSATSCSRGPGRYDGRRGRREELADGDLGRVRDRRRARRAT